MVKVKPAALYVRITRHHDLAIRLDGDAVGIVVAADEVAGDLPINIEGRVQGAVAVVAGKGKVIAGGLPLPRMTCHHDPAIALDGDAAAVVLRVGEVGGDQAVPIKGRIEAAVADVAGHGKVIAAGSLVRVTRRHDLAIRLDGHAVGPVVRAGEVGGDLPITSKGRIEAAVAVIAGQGKVMVEDQLARRADDHRARLTRRHDLAIRLDGHAIGTLRDGPEVGGDLPINIEGRVQGAVAVVAGQGKVMAGDPPRRRTTRRHDLAIRLDGDAVGIVDNAGDVRGDLAVTTKGCIQAAIAVVAGQGKVIARGQLVRITRHYDLAIRLDGDAAGIVLRAGEVGGDLATRPEGRVQAAIGVVAGQRKVIHGAQLVRITRHHDLAIRLDGHAIALVRPAGEVGDDQAAGEGRVQVARAEQQARLKWLERRRPYNCTIRRKQPRVALPRAPQDMPVKFTKPIVRVRCQGHFSLSWFPDKGTHSRFPCLRSSPREIVYPSVKSSLPTPGGLATASPWRAGTRQASGRPRREWDGSRNTHYPDWGSRHSNSKTPKSQASAQRKLGSAPDIVTPWKRSPRWGWGPVRAIRTVRRRI